MIFINFIAHTKAGHGFHKAAHYESNTTFPYISLSLM